MQKVKNWFIRTFGLRGSFQWALRQMKKGEVVMRANARYSYLYRATQSESLNGLTINVQKNWNGGLSEQRSFPAILTIEDYEATDWIVIPNADAKPPNPDNQ